MPGWVTFLRTIPAKEITDRVLESPPEMDETPDETPNWRERQTSFRGKDPLLRGIRQRVMRFVSNHILNSLPPQKNLWVVSGTGRSPSA